MATYDDAVADDGSYQPDVPADWAPEMVYAKGDLVKHGEEYHRCVKDHVAGIGNKPSDSSGHWATQ